jgi:hypothetical protein
MNTKRKVSIFFLYILMGLMAKAQSFDYMTALQTYWKYRYRLVGDYIESDSFPAILSPSRLSFLLE